MSNLQQGDERRTSMVTKMNSKRRVLRRQKLMGAKRALQQADTREIGGLEQTQQQVEAQIKASQQAEVEALANQQQVIANDIANLQRQLAKPKATDPLARKEQIAKQIKDPILPEQYTAMTQQTAARYIQDYLSIINQYDPVVASALQKKMALAITGKKMDRNLYSKWVSIARAKAKDYIDGWPTVSLLLSKIDKQKKFIQQSPQSWIAYHLQAQGIQPQTKIYSEMIQSPELIAKQSQTRLNALEEKQKYLRGNVQRYARKLQSQRATNIQQVNTLMKTRIRKDEQDKKILVYLVDKAKQQVETLQKERQQDILKYEQGYNDLKAEAIKVITQHVDRQKQLQNQLDELSKANQAQNEQLKLAAALIQKEREALQLLSSKQRKLQQDLAIAKDKQVQEAASIQVLSTKLQAVQAQNMGLRQQLISTSQQNIRLREENKQYRTQLHQAALSRQAELAATYKSQQQTTQRIRAEHAQREQQYKQEHQANQQRLNGLLVNAQAVVKQRQAQLASFVAASERKMEQYQAQLNHEFNRKIALSNNQMNELKQQYWNEITSRQAQSLELKKKISGMQADFQRYQDAVAAQMQAQYQKYSAQLALLEQARQEQSLQKDKKIAQKQQQKEQLAQKRQAEKALLIQKMQAIKQQKVQHQQAVKRALDSNDKTLIQYKKQKAQWEKKSKQEALARQQRYQALKSEKQKLLLERASQIQSLNASLKQKIKDEQKAWEERDKQRKAKLKALQEAKVQREKALKKEKELLQKAKQQQQIRKKLDKVTNQKIQTKFLKWKDSSTNQITIRQCFKGLAAQGWIATTRGINYLVSQTDLIEETLAYWGGLVAKGEAISMTKRLAGTNLLMIIDLYKGKRYYGLREGYYSRGQFVPTRRGFNISEEDIPDFLRGVKQLVPREDIISLNVR